MNKLKCRVAPIFISCACLLPVSVQAADTSVDSVTITGTDPFLSLDKQSATAQKWDITNNKSSNREFSISDETNTQVPFTISSGATSNSFFMDFEGKVGLGTNTPGGSQGSKLTISDTEPGITFDAGVQQWDFFGESTGAGIFDVTGMATPFAVETGASSWTLLVDSTSQVGIGTDTPEAKLHVKDGNLKVEQSGTGVHAILDFATQSSNWEIKQNGTTGRLTFFSPGGGATTASFKFAPQAQENLFRVGVVAGDTVDINGKLMINGSEITPDYVFEPGYALESIEEHADLMWKYKHLPALPGAGANENGVDVVKHQYGTLEELEKAHIYIDQLNTALKDQSERIKQLEESLAQLMSK